MQKWLTRALAAQAQSSTLYQVLQKHFKTCQYITMQRENLLLNHGASSFLFVSWIYVLFIHVFFFFEI